MIPVLIIGYNRLEELRSLLENCISQGVERVYVSIDGPKSENADLSTEFQAIFDRVRLSHPRVNMSTWVRKDNLGSAVSVISSIDWVFQYEAEIVILEDDLKISNHLIQYFKLNLKNLNSQQIMISGTNVFTEVLKTEGTGTTHFPVVWGWSTNAQNWARMRSGLLSAKLKYPKRTSLSLRCFLETGRIRAQRCEIDAWDVPLAAWMYANQLECLVASKNLVSNIGFGLNATHTTEKKWPMDSRISESIVLDESWDASPPPINLDLAMIELVFGVKFRHILSGIVVKFRHLLLTNKKFAKSLKSIVDSIEIPDQDARKRI